MLAVLIFHLKYDRTSYFLVTGSIIFMTVHLFFVAKVEFLIILQSDMTGPSALGKFSLCTGRSSFLTCRNACL